jgi:ankyrin repeat protein
MTAARQNSVECTQLLLAAGSNPDTVWKQNNNSTALICAAESGSGEVMRLLIRGGANVNVKNTVGQTALHVAVEKNAPENVRLLLRSGADASIQDNDGQSGLILSTMAGSIDCMYLMLGSGCDRNVQDTKGNTALLWAAWQGNVDCLKLLLKAGCDANLQNRSGNTAAIICADVNAHECLKVIVQKAQERAVEFDRTNKEGDSAVVVAARKNHMESFQLLIGCVGVDLNIRDAKGNTALIWCVCNANPHATKMLLDVGGGGGRVVEVGAQNQFGHTALMFAAERNDNVECLKLLIAATTTNTTNTGGNAVHLLDMKNSNGDTALLLAVKNKCVEAIKLLVAAGADIDIQDSTTGSTALHLAAKDNSKEMIKILLSSSKNGPVDCLNVKDATDGNTPLLIAAERNDAQCLSLLLSSSSSSAAAAAAVDLNIQNNRGKTILNLLIEHKATRAIQELLSKHSLDPNIPDAAHDNSTSLVLAMKLRCFDIVRLLLDTHSTSNNKSSRCAVDPNISDTRGNTALILACDMKHEEMAALLLKHGADPDMSNSEGDSPLIIATKNKSPEIIKLLLKSNSCFKDVVDGKGNTAVIWAAWKCFPDCLKLLLDSGCWCDAQNTVLKSTALCLVADKGDMDLVCLKLLLTAGADPNIVDGNGEGPLHLATRNGSIENVKLLIKAGSDKDAPDDKGNSALLIAMKAMATGIGTGSSNGTGDGDLTNDQWMELVKYLIIDAQVNPNVQDREQGGGSSPLMIAAGMVAMDPSFNSTTVTVASAGIECMKMLLSSGSKTELQEGSGSKNTALLIATQRQNVEGVSLLLKYGADPDVRDCNGDSPIILAAKQQQQQSSPLSSEGGGAPPSSSCCVEILKLLLKNGAYVDMKDNGGDTALIWAIKSRNIVFVRELLVQHQKQSIKCNINATGVNNNTALILAASTDQPDCVAMLIAGGADLEMYNVYGTSAMKAAVALRDQKCRMILRGAGAVDSYGGSNGIMAEGSVVGTKEGGAPAPGTGFSTAPSGSLTPEGNMDARTTAKVAGGALSCIAAVFLIVLECV